MRLAHAMSAVTIMASAGAAHAITDFTMYEVGVPLNSFGTLVASLDVGSTTYSWPYNAGLFTNSGYIRNGPGGIALEKTDLISEVYRVTSATSFTMGPNTINLDPGDRVFAYHIRIVSDNGGTAVDVIDRLSEFQVKGLNVASETNAVGPTVAMDANLIKGRGILTSAFNKPVSSGATDFNNAGALGSQLEWDWPSGLTNQLDNDQWFTLLMFTEKVLWANGNATFSADPPGPSATDRNANRAPVLIPIIPAPGAAALAAVALGASARRRRRSD